MMIFHARCLKPVFTLPLICLLVLSSCAPEQPTPPIRFASNAWAGFEPFFMAETLNVYPENSVHISETPRSLALAYAFRGATIDAAAFSLSRAMVMAQDDLDLTIVLVLDSSHGADVILAKPGIQRFEDLRGKTVAAEMSSVSGYLLLRALELHGMKQEDIRIVDTSPQDMAAGFEAGMFDAVALYGVQKDRVENAGAVTIFDSASLEDEIVDVLAVRTSYLNNNADRVVDLIEGWIRASQHLSNLKDGDPIPFGAQDPDIFRAHRKKIKLWGPEENLTIFKGSASKLKDLLMKKARISKDIGLIKNAGKIPAVDDRYFKAALNRIIE